MIVLIITYLQRLKFLNKFPKSLIDSVSQSVRERETEIAKLKVELENIEKSKNFERYSLINDSISKTIVGLNNQTCTLNARLDPFDEVYSKLCEKYVEDGLAEILTSFNSEIYAILKADNAKITIGTYFASIAQDTGGNSQLPTEVSMYLTLKDDNSLKSTIPIDIVENKTIQGDLHKLQQVIETCLRNNRFVIEKLNIFSSEYSLSVSPIPYACSAKDTSGALIFF